MLAWKRVDREVADGTLGGDFDRTDRTEIQSKVTDAETAVKDEIWGSYRFVVIADGLPAQAGNESNGLKVIDLGAGHSSGGETLCARVLTALKSQAILNDSVGDRVHRTKLATGFDGMRRMADGESSPEFSERIAHAAT